jgi:hypothetical protein
MLLFNLGKAYSPEGSGSVDSRRRLYRGDSTYFLKYIFLKIVYFYK